MVVGHLAFDQVDLAALLGQDLKDILGQVEMVDPELGIVAVEFRRSLGLRKEDSAVVKVAAVGKMAAVVVVVEIGLVVTVVGNWHRTAESFEAVKKVAVVEQDSMKTVLVAVGPVENAVSAAGSRIHLVGLRVPSAAAEVSGPNRGKQIKFGSPDEDKNTGCCSYLISAGLAGILPENDMI